MPPGMGMPPGMMGGGGGGGPMPGMGGLDMETMVSYISAVALCRNTRPESCCRTRARELDLTLLTRNDVLCLSWL